MRMLTSFAISTAVACSACASADALRTRAHRHAPIIVAGHVAAPLTPAIGLAAVNPLDCFGIRDWATLLCLPVAGIVDLVALPVQAVRRHGQSRDLDRITASCPVTDPAARLADHLADRMIRDFEFSPPDSAGSPDAVVLEVRTADFARSSRVMWEGKVVFGSKEGEILWKDACAAETHTRDVEAFEDDCEAARAEVAALADECVESVVGRIRDAWSRGPTPAPDPDPSNALSTEW